MTGSGLFEESSRSRPIWIRWVLALGGALIFQHCSLLLCGWLGFAASRRLVESARECKQKKFFRETEDSRDPPWVAVGEYPA